MFKPILFCAASAMAIALPQPAPAQANAQSSEETRPMNQADEAHAILETLADDYRNDPMAINDIFGIKLATIGGQLPSSGQKKHIIPKHRPI